MLDIQLGVIDYALLIIYFAFVLGIGFALRHSTRTSTDFFLSGRSIPAWITGLAFISANLGAQEVIGMAASGAKYGIMTSHFYWVGAIPAMVFVGIFMMPFYYGSKARSVPEYLKLRFDEKTRAFNAISFAVMTVFSSGISMHVLAKLLEQILGFNYHLCIVVSAVIVLVYIFLGGLTSAIYNEVLQFFLIVLGFLPAGVPGPEERRRLGRPGGQARRRGHQPHQSRRPGLRARRLDAVLGPHEFAERQPDGRRMVRHGDGAGLRAVVRLLVHGLPGGAAGHGRQLDVRRPAHAADRRRPQDALPGPGDPARHDRHRPAPRGGAASCRKDASGAVDYNMTVPAMLANFFPPGIAGHRHHGADGLVHVRHGRQRDGVQHRLDLRHLPELHPARASPTSTTCGWATSSPSSAS